MVKKNLSEENCNIFNRDLLRQNRVRAFKNFAQFDFLFKEIASYLIEKISDFDHKNFANILEIGARDGFLGQEILRLKKGGFLLQTDPDFSFAKSCQIFPMNEPLLKQAIVMDDEFLSFKENSFDLIVSNLNLHFINNVPQNLLQIKKILKENGLFIAGFFGGQTLKELRQVFYRTEEEIYGGITPRIIPFIDVKEAGMLLSKCGFKNPVADIHNITISYSHPFKLLQDLKNMGEGNILHSRSSRMASKRFLQKIAEFYSQNYKNSDDGINAGFEIITVSGTK